MIQAPNENIINLPRLLNQRIRQVLFTLLIFCLSTFSAYAQQRLDSLRKVLKSNITDQEKVNTYNELAKIYSDKRDSANTIQFAQQAIQLSKQLKNDAGQIVAYYWIGRLHTRKGNYDIAQKNLQQSLTMAQKRNDITLEARAYFGLGENYRRRGQYPQAMTNYKASLKIYQTLKDELATSEAYLKISSLLTRQGAYSQALEYSLKARKTLDKSTDKKLLRAVYTSLGIIYYYQKNYPKTLEYYGKALKINLQLGRNYAVAINRINVGYVYYQLKNYPKALEYFFGALEVVQNFKIKRLVASCHFAIGEVRVAQGRYDEAIVRLEKALDGEGKNDDSQAIIAIYFGQIYFKQQKHPLALQYLNKGLAIAKRIKNQEQLRKGYQLLAKTYEVLGDYRLAYQNYQLFKQAADSLTNEESAKRITRLEGEYQFAKEKDSLQYVQQKKQVAFDAEIEKRRANQRVTYIGLGLVSVLLIISILFFLDKQKSNRKLSVSNTKLEQSYEEIKANNEEIRSANDQVMAMNNSLQDALGTVQHQKDDILASINYAQRIQKAMLPRAARLQKAFPEHFIFFRPRDIVSGDFYWFAELESRPAYANQTGFHATGKVLEGFTNQKYILAAIDCTGHGVPGAFMSMVANNLLNYIVNKRELLFLIF